ncbi:hypothetical protein ACFL2H_09920, partial [Planctomycetota bacterium]
MPRRSRLCNKLSLELLEQRRLLTRLPDFVPVEGTESLAFETHLSTDLSPEQEFVAFETSLDAGHRVVARATSSEDLSVRVLSPNREVVANGIGSVQFETNGSGDYTFEVSSESDTNVPIEFEALIDAIYEDNENDLVPDSVVSLDDHFLSFGSDVEYLVVRGERETPLTTILETDFSTGQLPGNWEIEDWYYSGNVGVTSSVHPPGATHSLLSEGKDELTVNAVKFQVEIPDGKIPKLSFDHAAWNDETDQISLRHPYGDGVQYSFDGKSWQRFGSLRESEDGEWAVFEKTFSREVNSDDGSAVPMYFRILHVANGLGARRAFANVRVETLTYASDRFALTLEPGEPLSVSPSDFRMGMTLLDSNGDVVVEGLRSIGDFRNHLDVPAEYYLQFDKITATYDVIILRNGVVRDFVRNFDQPIRHSRLVADAPNGFKVVADQTGRIQLDVQTPYEDFSEADAPSFSAMPTLFVVSEDTLTVEPIDRGLRHVINVTPHEQITIGITPEGGPWRAPFLLTASGIDVTAVRVSISKWETSQFPASVSVEFSSLIVAETLRPSQLSIGGVEAIGVDASSKSATFTFPPIDLLDGNYQVDFFHDETIAVAGQSLSSSRTIVEHDKNRPRLVRTTPAFHELVEPTTEIRIEFDETLLKTQSNPVLLQGELRDFQVDVTRAVSNGSVDVDYLPEDNYSVVIPKGVFSDVHFNPVEDISLRFSTDHSEARTLRFDEFDRFGLSSTSAIAHGAIHRRRDEDTFEIIGRPRQPFWLALDVLNSGATPSLTMLNGASVPSQRLSDRTRLFGPLTLGESGLVDVVLGGDAAYAYELHATTHPHGESYSNEANASAGFLIQEAGGVSIYQVSGQTDPAFRNGDNLYATRLTADGQSIAIQLDPGSGVEMSQYLLPKDTDLVASIGSNLLLRTQRTLVDRSYLSLMLIDPITNEQIGSFRERNGYDILADTPDPIETIGGLGSGAYDANRMEIATISDSRVIRTNLNGKVLSNFRVSPASQVSSVGIAGDSYFVNEGSQVSVFSTGGEFLRTWETEADLGFTFARSSLAVVPDDDRFEFDLSDHVGHDATFSIDVEPDEFAFEGVVEVMDSSGRVISTFDSTSEGDPSWSVVGDGRYSIRVLGNIPTRYQVTVVVNASIEVESPVTIADRDLVLAANDAGQQRGFAIIGDSIIEFDPVTGAKKNTLATALQASDVTVEGNSLFYAHGRQITRLDLDTGEETTTSTRGSDAIEAYGDLLLNGYDRTLEVYDLEAEDVLDRWNRLTTGRTSFA